MNFLSLFNGYGGLALVLDMLGITPKKIYSSEIDKYANQAAQALYPDTIQMGDITKWRDWDIDFSKIDLLTAGFPCQAWSMAGKMEGDNDPRGALVHDLIDIWTEIKKKNPNVKFMFENVKMKKEFVDYVNKLFGVEPILINSALVSPQNRVRNYWNNLGCADQPVDTKSSLIDILEDLPDCPIGAAVRGRYFTKDGIKETRQKTELRSDNKSNCITTVGKDSLLAFKVREKSKCVRVGGKNSPFGGKHEWDSPFQRVSKKGKIKSSTDEAACLTVGANSGGNHSDMDILHTEHVTRRYSVRECARLQGIPEHKIDILLNCGISNTQLYKMIGNGWQLDTVKHVLGNLKPYT